MWLHPFCSAWRGAGFDHFRTGIVDTMLAVHAVRGGTYNISSAALAKQEMQDDFGRRGLPLAEVGPGRTSCVGF